MPTYEFRCTRCGDAFERFMKMSDPSPSCPACASSEVKKLPTAGNFLLKGGGWYKDHYGLKASSSSSSSSSEAAPRSCDGAGGGACGGGGCASGDAAT